MEHEVYEDIGEVELKTGETVQLGIVRAPDADWRERLEEFLGHKGGVWNWQNAELLKSDVAASSGHLSDPTNRGIETRYYVLHRGGLPFTNVMVAEHGGVGIFGHVFTKPEDRRKGAMGRLVEGLMDDFRARGGKALFLGTGFDSVPYHLYERYGFKGIEPGSGCMAYYASSGSTEPAEFREAFEAEYFAAGSAVIEDVGWRHWPSSPALFTGDFPGVVRCAPLRMIGRGSTERTVLELIREASENESPPRAVAARLESSGAVAGLAAWGWDALWPGTCLVDVYCHPDHWERAGELLQALHLPAADRYVAYADSGLEPKDACLCEAGFRRGAKLAGWARSGGGKARALDVQVYRRSSS